MATVNKFVKQLSGVNMPNVFNPYRDICEIHDKKNAASLRRKNLGACLESVRKNGVKTIWVARDLGHRGGRRTGIPLTDEANLNAAREMFGSAPLSRATVGPTIAEQTAATIWQSMSEVREPVMLWNVFPFHPHEPSESLSNRCHTSKERLETWPIFLDLIDLLRPTKLIAIGNDAEKALRGLSVATEKVRHPSYGGKNEFILGIRSIYKIKS